MDQLNNLRAISGDSVYKHSPRTCVVSASWTYIYLTSGPDIYAVFHMAEKVTSENGNKLLVYASKWYMCLSQ